MFEFSKLQFRKDIKMLGAMLAVFYAFLLFFGWIEHRGQHRIEEAAKLVVGFWSLVALPLVALFFGGALGEGLRAENAVDIDRPLPLSPAQRAGGTVLAGAAYLALLMLAIFVTGLALIPDARVFFQSGLNLLLLPALFAVLMHALLAAFIGGYVLSSGIIGVGLTMIVMAIISVVEPPARKLAVVFGPRASYAPGLAVAEALVVAGLLASLVWAARWRQRRPSGGWLYGVRIVAAVLAPGIFLLIFNAWFAAAGQKSLQLASFWGMGLMPGVTALSPASLRAAASGAPMESLDGTLVWMGPDARRSVLIAGKRRTARDILGFREANQIMTLALDRSGRLWTVRRGAARGDYAVWSGPVSGPLKEVARFSDAEPKHLIAQDGSAYLLGLKGANDWVETELTSDARPVTWKPVVRSGRPWNWVNSKALEGVPTAVASADSTTLTQVLPDHRKRVWRLPGKIRGSAVYMGYGEPFTTQNSPVRGVLLGGKTVFLLNLEMSKGRNELAVCRDDGKVELPWTSFLPRMLPSLGGGLYGWQVGPLPLTRRSHEIFRRLLLATPDGRFLPPIKVEGLEMYGRNRADVLRMDGNAAWLLTNDRTIVKIDVSTGRRLAVWTLPDESDVMSTNPPSLKAVDAGLFVRTPSGLFLYDWDGRRRRLAL